MKKCFSFILALILLCALQMPAQADIGLPEFDDWYVVCGQNGWDFEDEPNGPINDTPNYYQEHIEPGTRLQVHSFSSDSNTYLLITMDDNFKPKGTGFVTVTEQELEEYFYDENETVPAEQGNKQNVEVKCKVTSDNGVMLRQGPARTYPRYLVVPMNAEITYQYTYSYGGYNWCYTTYNGQTGWMCIDYSEKLSETPIQTPAAPPAEETAEPQPTTTQPAPPVIPAEDTQTEPEASADEIEPEVGQTDEMTSQSQQTAEKSYSVSRTLTIILICCFCAVVLALTAMVILLIINRKRIR